MHRLSSKKPPLVLMLTLYPALPIWLVLVGVSVTFGTMMYAMDGVCNTEEVSFKWPHEQSLPVQTRPREGGLVALGLHFTGRL